jgi:hypothetical protein
LPKIWGNIACPHASAVALGLLLSGCGNDAGEGRVVPIRARWLDGCGGARPELYQLEALGDFDASTLTSETLTQPGAEGTPLRFPAATRAVELRGEGGPTTYRGLGELGPEGAIDVLLLPSDSGCDLVAADPGRPYPLDTGGHALGFSSRHRVLLLAGGLSSSADSARALAVRVDTGVSTEVVGGMIPGRAFASITELGPDALLVAGGIDPSEGPDGPALASAIVYDARENRFDRSNLIPLSKPRARHGAVVLASGETLLVGGSGSGVLGSLEAVSPLDRAARIEGLASLREAREQPRVLRLDDGRLFVGGGRGASGEPVHGLEWLSPDAAKNLTPDGPGFRVAAEPAFAPMPGGSVLAIGVCSADMVSCPAERVAWLRADFRLDPLPALPFSPTAPELVPAADASPLLIATAPAGARVVLRFDPWLGLFSPADDLPEAPAPATLPLDAGMFVWLAPRTGGLALRALRHGTRNRWSRDVAPLLLADARHLGPDRAPGAALGYGAGGLYLASSDALAPRALVTDTSYESLRLELELGEGPPPRIALGAALFGDADCAWPDGDGALVLRRIGASVTLERSGQRVSCSIGKDRVSIALVAPAQGTANVRGMSVRRSPD